MQVTEHTIPTPSYPSTEQSARSSTLRNTGPHARFSSETSGKYCESKAAISTLKRGMRHSKANTSLILVGCALWLGGLGWLDRATGYELGLFAFYTAPVAVVAWNLGQGPGMIAAFVASVIWYMADRYAGDHYSRLFYGYWNTGMHFTTFIINAVTFAKIKSSFDQRRELERVLEESRSQRQQLLSVLPVCSRCRKPFLPVSLRIKSKTEPTATAVKDIPEALCDDCLHRAVSADSASAHQRDFGASISQ